MKESCHTASLLPYLDSKEGPSYLKITLATQEPLLLEKTTTPFLILSEPDGFSQLMEAQFLTDNGKLLGKVFLLVQKDRYRLTGNELWPIKNPDVENGWQRAFSFFKEEHASHQLRAFSIQVSPEGRLLPLAPLFFCKTTQRFFSPPCPRCGALLEQCTDDEVLLARGLQPYSHSLKRYLSCPSCPSVGASDFYVYEMDNNDPPDLKDRWTLIKEFRLLAENSVISAKFPCHSCVRHEECYGPDIPALSRVVPFSFYPFHLLVFEGMSLHASDFLALVSGAPFEEVEAGLKMKGEFGRLHCLRAIRDAGLLETLFLYALNDKFFLEVLYLKLSFLSEVAKVLCSTKTPGQRSTLSIEGMWLKIADQTGFLPSLWNFRCGSFVLSGPAAHTTAAPVLPFTSVPSFLGRLWFYTLLANKQQTITEISLALEDCMSQARTMQGDASSRSFEGLTRPMFFPGNLLWASPDKEVPPAWRLLWEKCIQLGWSMYLQGVRGEVAQPLDTFMLDLENVRAEARSLLFESKPDYSSPLIEQTEECSVTAQTENDAAIRTALLKLMDKWKSSAKAYEVKPEPQTEESAGFAETVILPVRDTRPQHSPEKKETIPEETVVISSGTEEQLSETIIISPTESGKQPEPGAESSKNIQPAQKKSAREAQGEEFIAETVILTIDKKER